MLKYSTYRSIYEKTPKVDPIENRYSPVRMISSLFTSKRFRQANLIKLLMILMLVVSGFTVVGNVFASSISQVKHQEKRVVVVRGDTLWSIAMKNKPSDMRTVVYIEGIKQYSGLENSSIQAGDILSLPIY
ncbi:LysM peptidoglycan-binding domain-containing protein [Paenibacillus wynnii]|uniref:LysM peptidoglycan-binding domain-containing protein n=1 Tax=Paenibacillus wynnii TaxID=268407 RepID=UPI0027940935|nr:LysM peptidoglycan-binding domain-containing protein [Paenibacillus wynnii]MDQ0194869.1 LysM repeat protein [Paenibacillus wynnii]